MRWLQNPYRLLALFLIVFGFASISLTSQKANALTGSSFNPGNIIANSVFTNNLSMTVNQIQNFLNAEMPSCDTNGAQSKTYYYNQNSGQVSNSSFSGASQVTTTRAVYGQRYDSYNGVTIAATPYVCLNAYVENPSTGTNNLQNPSASISGGLSSAQIIYNAAQAYNINPEVLIVTLQKEQGLVTDDWPWTNEYKEAMGYNCPDNGSCSGFAGFYQQVTAAAKQFRNYLNNPNNFNYVVGNNNVAYSPSCSGTTIYIQNQATAALYDYTPYQPNANVLNNTNPTGSSAGPGPSLSDSCAAYGNRNFWWYFNTWFGSTTGVDYSWAYAGISFSNGSSNVMGNDHVTVTVTAQNTGNQAWSATNYPVRLATFAPTNHGSALYDPSWVSGTRLATVSPATVAPGGTGTFTFVVDVPNIQEVYQEHFNLVAEGATWFPDVGFTLTLNITASHYTWQMVSQSSTNGFLLAPGQTSQFTLVAKNTGNVTWSNSNNPVRLATFIPTNRQSAFYTNSWLSSSRPATLTEASVPPGGTGTFTFNVTAPQTEGFYAERFNLVMEGVSWFTDPWMEFDVTVKRDLTWHMVSQTSSTGSFVLPRNSTAQFTLTVKNDGNMTWNNSSTPVRLATWNPSYRTSVFNPNDGSWPSTYRAATLNETSVAPGGTGTFTFNVKAPSKPGNYVERFNLVMEGVAWMPDPWLEFDITVN